jgi:hypothetical protein
MACATNSCLVVDGRKIAGRAMIVATRVSSAGAILSTQVLAELNTVASTSMLASVASSGSGLPRLLENRHRRATAGEAHRGYTAVPETLPPNMPFGVLATSDGKGLSLLGYPYADPLHGGRGDQRRLRARRRQRGQVTRARATSAGGARALHPGHLRFPVCKGVNRISFRNFRN